MFIWLIIAYCIGVFISSTVIYRFDQKEGHIYVSIDYIMVGILSIIWPALVLLGLIPGILLSIGWLGEKIDEKLSGTKDETQSPFAPYPRDHPPAPTE